MPLEGLLFITPENITPFVISIIVLVLLLILSALVSGSEVAFFSLSPVEVKELQDEQSKRTNSVLRLLEKPKELLATILILNNFINVGIVILSSYVSGLIMPENISATTQLLIELVCITFVILLIGEIIPKVYATKNAIRLSKIMCLPLTNIGKFFLFKWLRILVVKSADIFKRAENNSSMNVSSDELEQALELTRDENTDEEEHKILRGIVKFGNTEVSQIMKSRVDVTAVSVEVNYNELMELILDCGYSRIPVFQDDFDNIKGVLYIKDLLPHIDEEINFNWQNLIRETLYVPENKKIDDLLKEFQGQKMHMAIVVDEYGGSSGIVTLEDVLEEIVGEITDEFDDDELVYSKLDDLNYVFDAKTLLIDLFKVLEIEGEEFEEIRGDADTIAGLLMELSGKILKKNEKVKFDRYTFTVEAADKRKIKLVKITINNEEILSDDEKN